MVSDHCPIICQCSTVFPKPNTFQFENYWLKLPEFQELVLNTWQQHGKTVTPSQLQEKLVMLRRCIAHWRRDRLGDINNQEKICKTALKWLEKQEKNRHITSLEKIMKKILQERFEEISIIKETIWSQRAKRQWIREGDKNTSFFHTVATIQKR
jgi:hypothetical protein